MSNLKPQKDEKKRKSFSKRDNTKEVKKPKLKSSKRDDKINQLELLTKEANKLTAKLLVKPKEEENNKKLKAKNKPNQEKLVNELHDLLNKNIADVAMKHDACRSIQTLFKFGNESQRKEILQKLEFEKNVIILCKGKYSVFTVISFLKCANHSLRINILKSMQSSFASFATHSTAANVVETVLKLPHTLKHAKLTREQTKELKNTCNKLWISIFGHRFTLLPKNIQNALLQHNFPSNINSETDIASEQKSLEAITQVLRNTVSKQVEKGLAKLEFVHKLSFMLISLSNLLKIDLKLVDTLIDPFLLYFSTLPGAKTVCHAITLGNAKERKKMIKQFNKETILSAVCHEFGFLVISSLICCTDDIVLLKKSIIKPIDSSIPSLVTDEHAIKLLTILMCPKQATRVIDKSCVQFLTGKNETTKKDVTEKLGDLIDASFLNKLAVNLNIEELINDRFGHVFLYNLVVKLDSMSKSEELIKSIVVKVDEDASLLEGNYSHRLIKDLLLETNSEVLAKGMWDLISSELANKIKSNRTCFVIAAILKVSKNKSYNDAVSKHMSEESELAGIKAIRNEL